MPEIILDTFDPDILIKKIVTFLKSKHINEISLNYFSLEIDDEIKKTISIDQLQDKWVDLYEADEGHIYFNVESISCSFEYDNSNMVIKFPEKFKEEMETFNQNLL
jgi:hypothetical protein